MWLLTKSKHLVCDLKKKTVRRPEGQPRRRLDVEAAYRAFGFRAETGLETGMREKPDLVWQLKLRDVVKRAVRATAVRMSPSKRGQDVLERLVLFAQYLQGIGAGGDVASSGEAAIFARLKRTPDLGGRPRCVFDVGANRGQFLTMALDQLWGTEFHAHAFEPSIKSYRLLCEAARKYPNVTLNNAALGREQGERELFYDVEGSALASLTRRQLKHFGIEMSLSEKVKVETLDGYCCNHGVEYIDLLKLDVEGHELDVLSGGKRMFERSAVGMVTFEFGGCNIDTRTFMQDFFYFFHEQGMRMARIIPSGYLYDLTSYRESLEQFRTTNFVCYRP